MNNQTIEMCKIADNVIGYCTEIANDQNLEYYTFQSPVSFTNTQVLIVGVNPRSKGDNESQAQNAKWEFEDKRMTVDRFLKGNPYYLNDSSWRFFYNLQQVNFLKNVIDNDQYTYMNYFYFSTSDAAKMKKIKNFNSIVAFSKDKLAEIISVLKPKLVLILGVKDGLDIISDSATVSRLKKENRRVLTEGSVNGIKVYGIPHSSRGYAHDIREALDINLANLFNDEPLIGYDFQTIPKVKPTVHILDIEKINNTLKPYHFSFSAFQDKPTLFKGTFTYQDDVLDFRLNTDRKNGYLALRAEDKLNGSFFNHLKEKEHYINAWEGSFSIEKESWLIKRTLKDYPMNGLLEEHIAADIIKLITTKR